MSVFDPASVPSPCYVIDLARLEANLRILDSVRQRTGCRILLALKSFAMFSTFPLLRRTLRGVCASSLHEARLGREEFGGEVHLFAPAYRPDEFPEILCWADHVIFNSFDQWRRFRPAVAACGRPIECGLRVNPEHSEVKVALYDPCGRNSRLGIRQADFAGQECTGINGLHFHTLCELNADSLERTLAVVERRFDFLLRQVQWVNFGGGHHITRPDYDIDRLCRVIEGFTMRYPGVTVYLEPGEAVVLNSGVLVASVLAFVQNDMAIAILDTSAAAHMPDVLEMPYRPAIAGAGEPGKYPHTYRLGGMTCLAGDVIGDYSFPEALRIGDRLVFQDMAHYTMVKNNTFNGIRLPSQALFDPAAGTVRVVREFGYEDFRQRLS